METEPKYYFKKIREFPFPELFNAKKVWEILGKKDGVLKKLKSKVDVKVLDDVHISGDVVILEGTVLKPGTVIEGPVYIGKDCVIGPHAYIRKNTIIGNNCEIGRMEVKGSVIMNNVKAHHHGYIGDSIVGDSVNIGAGVVLTNFKFGGSDIKLGEINLGRKFGAVLGDGTSLGCNTCTMPGTFIGPETWIYPNCNVNGFVPENMIVKHKQPHEIVGKKK